MKIELFKDAIAIIRGIPEDRLNLEDWQSRKASSLYQGLRLLGHPVRQPGDIDCQTIACAAGWLALHPKMQKLGIEVSPSSGSPVFHSEWGGAAFAKLFNITEEEGVCLFSSRHLEEQENKISDRDTWVARALTLLAKYEAKREHRT
jgi:hypothetical protein